MANSTCSLRLIFRCTLVLDMRNLMTLKETAAILSVSYSRAAELARTGVLPTVPLGRQIRVDPQQLERFISQGGKRLKGGWRHAPP